MALIACVECQREISDKAVTCPHCGAPRAVSSVPPAIPSTNTPPLIPVLGDARSGRRAARAGSSSRERLWWMLSILGIGFLGFLAVYIWVLTSLTPEAKQRIRTESANAKPMREARRAIERCDSRYEEMNKDRQYTAEMLQFHSATCRYMKDEYRRKWAREP